MEAQKPAMDSEEAKEGGGVARWMVGAAKTNRSGLEGRGNVGWWSLVEKTILSGGLMWHNLVVVEARRSIVGVATLLET